MPGVVLAELRIVDRDVGEHLGGDRPAEPGGPVRLQEVGAGPSRRRQVVGRRFGRRLFDVAGRGVGVNGELPGEMVEFGQADQVGEGVASGFLAADASPHRCVGLDPGGAPQPLPGEALHLGGRHCGATDPGRHPGRATAGTARRQEQGREDQEQSEAGSHGPVSSRI